MAAAERPWTKRPWKKRWPMAFLALLAAALLLAGGVTVYRARSNQAPNHDELVGLGESFVQAQIPAGVRFAFSPFEETRVDRQGPDEYLVQGWVDLMGSERATERQAFSCVVHKDSWGEWVGEQINLMPQM
jgi:hypothetical protein